MKIITGLVNVKHNLAGARLSARPPFDAIRAGFLLLACVVLIMMSETLIALGGCVWVIVVKEHEPVGACAQVGGQVREIMTEMLTAILALIAASRPPPPPPPNP